MAGNMAGGQKQGHKYIKRTGTPGKYSYWYKYPDGSVRQGDPDKQRSGQREHASRLMAGKTSGQHKMTNEQISDETGAESSHVKNLETNMKENARRGRGHEFEDKDLAEASGDTMQARREKLESELETRASKKVDTDETLKKLEDSVKNIKEKMKDAVSSKQKELNNYSPDYDVELAEKNREEREAKKETPPSLPENKKNKGPVPFMMADGKVDEFAIFNDLKRKGYSPEDIEHEGHFEDAVYKEFPDSGTEIMNNIKDRGLVNYMARDFATEYDRNNSDDEEDNGIPEELAEKVKRLGEGEGRKVDLKPHELETLLESGVFALISSGRNPAIEEDKDLDDKTIKARHKELEADLVEGGYGYSPVTGHYEGSEDSFLVMVHDADRNHMEELGAKYNQDSVIYSEGGKAQGIYTTGENKGKMVYGEGHEITPSATDYFTEFSHSNGEVTKFSLNLWKDDETSKIVERKDTGLPPPVPTKKDSELPPPIPTKKSMVVQKSEPYFIFNAEPLIKSSSNLGIPERITLIKGILNSRKEMSSFR